MKKIFSLLLVLILLLTIGISAFAVTANFTVGQTLESPQYIYTKSAGETINSANVSSGSIPNGLTLVLDDARQNVYLTGTPTTAGSYSFIVTINGTDSTGSDMTRNVEMKGVVGNTIIGGDSSSTSTTTTTTTNTNTNTSSTTTTDTFAITKQPGAENRTAGGYAIFIAKASGASNATWTLVAPDGGQYSIDTFKSKFPKITINVDNTVTDGVLTSTITLNNVSTDVSGYSAFVTFSDDSGTIRTSNSASMTITAASPTPTATAKPAATVAPTTKPASTTAPTVAPTIAPTMTPAADAASTSPSPVPTDSPQTGSSNNTEVISHRSSSNVGAIVAIVLVGILTIAIAVVLILYVSGKLDLSWLEDKLEKKHHHDDDDDE